LPDGRDREARGEPREHPREGEQSREGREAEHDREDAAQLDREAAVLGDAMHPAPPAAEFEPVEHPPREDRRAEYRQRAEAGPARA